jgi:polysaccharide export outer membrane protein
LQQEISSLFNTQNGSTTDPTNSHGLKLIHRVLDTPPVAFFQSNGGSGNLRIKDATRRASVQQQIRPNALQLRVPPTTANGSYRIGVGGVLLLATKSASSSIEELSGQLAAQNKRQGYIV